MPCSIYVLVDPLLPDRVRYVGKTVSGLPVRLNIHLERRNQSHTHKNCWINSLLQEGRKPEIRAIEVVTSDDKNVHNIREKFWIAEYRQSGHDLTNGTDGGDGGKQSSESIDKSRAKISDKLKALWKEPKYRAKLVAARKRVWQDEKHKAKMLCRPPAHTQPHSQSAKEKIRAKSLEQWQSNAYRKHHQQAVKQAMASEEVKRKLSKPRRLGTQ